MIELRLKKSQLEANIAILEKNSKDIPDSLPIKEVMLKEITGYKAELDSVNKTIDESKAARISTLELENKALEVDLNDHQAKAEAISKKIDSNVAELNLLNGKPTPVPANKIVKEKIDAGELPKGYEAFDFKLSDFTTVPSVIYLANILCKDADVVGKFKSSLAIETKKNGYIFVAATKVNPAGYVKSKMYDNMDWLCILTDGKPNKRESYLFVLATDLKTYTEDDVIGGKISELSKIAISYEEFLKKVK